MKRLLGAAVLALLLHAGLLGWGNWRLEPLARPDLGHRELTLELAAVVPSPTPSPKPAPGAQPPPAPAPQPMPEPMP
ncbi:MAG: protein TolA, partial [Desulfurivibrio sp.]